MATRQEKSQNHPGTQAFLDSFMRSPDRLIILERAIESARNGVVITDPNLPDNPIVYANRAFLELTGYDLDEILGRNCRFLQADDRDQDGLKQVREGIAQGRPCMTLLRNYRKNGSGFWNELSIAPVYAADGKLINFIGVQNDVTARKEAERRVSEFYSMVSHELRTPLSSIRASLGLIDEGSAGTIPSPAAKLIRIALANAEQLLSLVDDILDMKKMEAGKLDLNLSMVQPVRLVTRVITSLESLAAENQVTLETIAETDRDFCADELRISQVLTNLVGNAIKFSPPRTRVVVRIEESSSLLRFSVSDQGMGIAESDLEKLFVKFQQLDSSDTRPHSGSGLGLAISKSIVELHGGKMGVDSRPGEGSTFWFALPLVPPA